jgi:D-alanyl-D-alanine carboxypeptidase
LPITACNTDDARQADSDRTDRVITAETPETGEQTNTPDYTSESAPDAGYEWELMLVNAKNPLPEGYVPPSLTAIGYHNGEERTMDGRFAPYAIAMISAAADDGITLTPISAYRGIERQEINFRNFFQARVNEGMSRSEAFDYTASWIAPPGTSEHQAGTAVDFNLIDESFENTEAFRWLQDNAHRFGFILRYGKDTMHITGIRYEPWHYTYVGIHNAEQIRETGVTLEEYIANCAEDDSVVDAFRNQLIN